MEMFLSNTYFAGFEVLMVVYMKMAVFWIIAFIISKLITLMVDAVRTSETLVNLHHSTWW
jgi:hypothetical protein